MKSYIFNMHVDYAPGNEDYQKTALKLPNLLYCYINLTNPNSKKESRTI